MAWLFSDNDPHRPPLSGWLRGAVSSRPRNQEPAAVWTALGGGARKMWRTPAAAWRRYGTVAVVDEAAGSQFDALLAWLRGAALARPALALALTGRGFHGHRGRPWSALRGNLHLSAAFPVARELGPAAVALAALPAVAVLDALSPWRRRGFQPGIKWVNDILAGGEKIAGVITATQNRGMQTRSVVFGIGLNVEAVPQIEPTVFVPKAGSLRGRLGRAAPELARIFPRVAAALARRFTQFCEQGPGPALRAYRAGSLLTGRAVRVWDEAAANDTSDLRKLPAPRCGVVRGIGDDLSLLLEGDGPPVGRGRLALEEACRAAGLPPPCCPA